MLNFCWKVKFSIICVQNLIYLEVPCIIGVYSPVFKCQKIQRVSICGSSHQQLSSWLFSTLIAKLRLVLFNFQLKTFFWTYNLKFKYVCRLITDVICSVKSINVEIYLYIYIGIRGKHVLSFTVGLAKQSQTNLHRYMMGGYCLSYGPMYITSYVYI